MVNIKLQSNKDQGILATGQGTLHYGEADTANRDIYYWSVDTAKKQRQNKLLATLRPTF